MKMSPAILLLIASALTSQVALSAPVTFEYWNCKGDGSGNVKQLVVNVDQQGRTAVGAVVDPGIRSTGTDVLASDALYELSGAYFGHDSVEYNVQLSPESADFSANSSSSKGVGSAVISYRGYIDCVGDVSRVEKLTCEVALIRK
jgi:hypothetical protein